jgi:hypothetical protein
MAQASEVAIPRASQFNFIFMRWTAKIINLQ